MFNLLSEKQKEIVFSPIERLVVRACPGSGKTFTVAARLANKILKWDKENIGIATLSFTNVAWQEIEKNLPKFGTESPILYPHFLGTIDSFVNRYIFLPFGHLVMGCENRPILVGEPYSPWVKTNQFDIFFEKLTYGIDREIYDKAPSLGPRLPKNNPNYHNKVLKTKKSLSKKGYATQDDANYFALLVLRDHQEVCRSLAGRFPILLIDEAQDTTETQMAIIDELINAGLQEVFLVGDPDQAIFEWNEANPQLFQTKFDEWQHKELKECRRSSQNICNFVYKLSTLSSPAVSVSPTVSCCEIQPQIIEYDSLSVLMNAFLDICKTSKIAINQQCVATLCRTKKSVNEVAMSLTNAANDTSVTISYNIYDIWKYDFSWCKDICEGGYLIERGAYKEGYKLVERGSFKALRPADRYSGYALKKFIEGWGIIKWRKFIHRIVSVLPTASNDFASWLSLFLPISKEYFNVHDLAKAIKKNGGHLQVDEVFYKADIDTKVSTLPIRLGTIHSAKGETFEATLVVLPNKIKNTKYETILNKCRMESLLKEELRTIYVAITRPRKIMVLGVPKGDGKMWTDFFNDHHFLLQKAISHNLYKQGDFLQ